MSYFVADVFRLGEIPWRLFLQMTADAFFFLAIAVVLAVVVFGFDDAFVDFSAWCHGLRPREVKAWRLAKRKKLKQKRIAIIVPTWKESAVIRRMLVGNCLQLDYDCYEFFVGVYPNDAATLAEVEEADRQTGKVHAVLGDRDGPTSKGQILNCVIRHIHERVTATGVSYDAVLMQDAEDMMHPQCLHSLNEKLDQADFIQLPVFSLEVPLSRLVAGTYADEFAESHTKDLLVRAALGAAVPSAGVGTGVAFHLINRLYKEHGRLFNEQSVTEDYELGLSLHAEGARSIFVCEWLRLANGRRDYIATREFFPSVIRRSIKQKTRWTIGISLQGWRNLGWQGSKVERYFRYRDRKALLVNPLNMMGYFCSVWLLAAELMKESLGLEVRGLSDVPPVLTGFALCVMINRICQRVVCTTRVYGVRAAALVPVRWPVANFINAVACIRAISVDRRARRREQDVIWEKTEHDLPPSFGAITVTQQTVSAGSTSA